jgi:LPS export ABC transporter protein LptC
MRWQKAARLAIAMFVLVFAAFVFMTLRQRRQPPAEPPPSPRTVPTAAVEVQGPLKLETYDKDGKVVSSITGQDQVVYPDGRTKAEKVTITLPDRDGRTFRITANEAEVTPASGPSQSSMQTAKLTGDVTLTTSDGATVRSAEGFYDDRQGVLQVPGAVTFSRGRMSGSGVGATYDRNREVLWLLDQARINIAPDPKEGGGPVEATAGSAGLARREHYARLVKTARIVAEGRIIEADDITVRMTEDDQRVQGMELRTNSRITGTGAGAQNMTARDIDLAYAPDGRALRSAKLMENAVVDLAAQGPGGSRRVEGRTIDITMSPDGAIVTNLVARDNVRVDLPAEGDLPAKRIHSSSLAATGAPGAGLQEATFTGNVDYRETRAARANVPAVNRTARADRLLVKTKPGLGAVQQADFAGHVRITDPPQVIAEAPRIIYHVEKDAIELMPGAADTSVVPHVTDGQVDVAARTIHFTLGTRQLNADTRVRSIVQAQRKPAGAANGAASPPQGRVPSMLKQDQPVFVTSNRLAYDGAASRAVYEGNARLWQGDSEIRGNTVELDDKSGNLRARGNVTTVMLLEDTDPKTQKRALARTAGRGESFDYDEAKRLAVYTGSGTSQANIVGPQGDVTADRIELYLKEGTNELERAVAKGSVFAKESNRDARGDHLTYTATDDLYVMTGTPVIAIEHTPPSCKKTTAPTITFRRSVENVTAGGNTAVASKTEQIPCETGKQF